MCRHRRGVLAIYGGLDDRINQNIPAIEAAMGKHGKTFRKIVYPNVDHAFHNDTAALQRRRGEGRVERGARVVRQIPGVENLTMSDVKRRTEHGTVERMQRVRLHSFIVRAGRKAPCGRLWPARFPDRRARGDCGTHRTRGCAAPVMQASNPADTISSTAGSRPWLREPRRRARSRSATAISSPSLRGRNRGTARSGTQVIDAGGRTVIRA